MRPPRRRGADRVAPAHLSLLRRIELDEIGARPFGLAYDDRDGEQGVRHRKNARSSTRARFGENESGHVRSGLGCSGHVLVPRQSTDLDERPREELRELPGGVDGAHQRGADEDRVGSCELGGGTLRARLDATLGDDDTIAR